MDKLLTPLSILIAGGLIGLSIIYSNNPNMLGLKTSDIQEIKNAVDDSTNPSQKVVPPAPTPSIQEVSMDNDAVLGDPNAPVTIIEFSDYECPYCKSYFQNTFPDIKKEYVDTGKVKVVYRDFPLSFHDPMATTEAIAAECVRKEGGDEKYFEFHDKIFENTSSNGNGLTVDQLYGFATDLGLSATDLKTCVEAREFEQEVKDDINYSSSVGVTGTPSFFVGKSGESSIKGELVVGAQPFSTFKDLIEKYLQN